MWDENAMLALFKNIQLYPKVTVSFLDFTNSEREPPLFHFLANTWYHQYF
jgi:hypothetical protein